jgi:hypothetical protein
MKKLLYISAMAITLLCCNANRQQVSIYSWLPKHLAQDQDTLPNNLLMLFIAENMCAECLNKEFQNIKNISSSKKEFKPLVVGVFKNKRHFLSTIATISEKCFLVYINTEECKVKELPQNPFYCTIDFKTQTASNVFYPQPCETDKTLSYLYQIMRNFEN